MGVADAKNILNMLQLRAGFMGRPSNTWLQRPKLHS